MLLCMEDYKSKNGKQCMKASIEISSRVEQGHIRRIRWDVEILNVSISKGYIVTLAVHLQSYCDAIILNTH